MARKHYQRVLFHGAETQVWLEYSVKCEYLGAEIGKELHRTYDNIIGKPVNMANNPKPWLLQGVGYTKMV